MKQIFLIIILVINFYIPKLQAQLKSDFPSTVPGLKVENAHLVYKEKSSIYRSSQIIGWEDHIIDFGITDVLIFKNSKNNDVENEISLLVDKGLSSDRIYHIPFLWKDLVSYEASCREIVDALKIIKKVSKARNRNLLFHCTVGEDRTGLLAGLVRMLNDGWSKRKAFRLEMCAHGYEAGSKKKPIAVVDAIRAGLTPLYLKMAYLVDEDELTWNDLDHDVCDDIEQVSVDTKEWVCR